MSKLNNQDIKKLTDESEGSDDSEDEELNQSTNQAQSGDKKKKKKKNKNKKKVQDAPVQSAMGKLILERKQKLAEEEAKFKALQEEEERKIREEEEARLEAIRKVEEEKERKRKTKQDKKQRQIEAGTYKTKTEKEKAKKNQERLAQLLKQSGNMIVDGKIVQDPNAKITVFEKTIENNEELEDEINQNDKMLVGSDVESDNESEEDIEHFRSIISCIMGHVDTGKTSLLDKIRGTNVQEGEAGGITQQIGATFIPVSTLNSKTSMLEPETKNDYKVPGLLMIDTPGHEVFTNLRTRGCAICDIAVLVVDLVHGLEPQTIESIKILQESNTKFIIALNKVDRLYGWVSEPDRSAQSSLKIQDLNTLSEFDSRLTHIKVQLMELGLNSELYWKNDSIEDTISMCPTSAVTGEGICDLLNYLIDASQKDLKSKITHSDEFNCVVMDCTITEGYGSTIDVILIGGTLRIGDKLIVSSTTGPVETTVRQILTPPPNRESRVKSEYIHHKMIEGAIGVKIVANDLGKTMAGTPVFKYTSNFEKFNAIDEAEQIINSDTTGNKFNLSEYGVSVYSSTVGSLEALMRFLQECEPPIQVSQAHIGKVMKKDIIKINIANTNKPKEFNTVLAFNVDVDDEAKDEAKKLGVKIFTAEIIYHLFDQYKKYKEDLAKERREAVRPYVVFPCVVKILPNCIFNRKNPLVIGVQVMEGKLQVGTPLFIVEKNLYLGNVAGIEIDRKSVKFGKVGTQVCVKLEYPERLPNACNYSFGKYIKSPPEYGNDFDSTYMPCSLISRNTIDLIKEHFREEVDKDDIRLLAKLKKILNIQ